MTKYNRSEIMKRAWALYNSPLYTSFTAALRQAWREAKRTAALRQAWREAKRTAEMRAQGYVNATEISTGDIIGVQERADMLKTIMIAELDARQADELAAGEYTIRYTLYESKRLDTAALKKALPDVAAQFTKATTSTRFQVA